MKRSTHCKMTSFVDDVLVSGVSKLMLDAGTSCRLAADGYAVRVTAKGSDISFNPCKSCLLIQKSKIGRRFR